MFLFASLFASRHIESRTREVWGRVRTQLLGWTSGNSGVYIKVANIFSSFVQDRQYMRYSDRDVDEKCRPWWKLWAANQIKALGRKHKKFHVTPGKPFW